MTSDAGYGLGCTIRREGSRLRHKHCHPEPGPYNVVVGKLARLRTRWGKLQVSGLIPKGDAR